MPAEPKNAVLQIWYNQHPYTQGKFFILSGKPYYLANIDEEKLFRVYNGYAISKRLMEAFERMEIRKLTIIYRYPARHLCYTTTPSVFNTKGILVKYGGHRQLVLPIKYWGVVEMDFKQDPKDLPIVNLETWANMPEYVFKDNIAILKERPTQQMLFG